MWDQVALRYNSRRPRSASERDFEALRRKFCSLYGKPKPSGINGEIPESKKPITKAHEIHHALELKAGSTDYNNGLDDGGDDEELIRHAEGVCDENRSITANTTVVEVEDRNPSDESSFCANRGSLDAREDYHYGEESEDILQDAESIDELQGPSEEQFREPGQEDVLDGLVDEADGIDSAEADLMTRDDPSTAIATDNDKGQEKEKLNNLGAPTSSTARRGSGRPRRASPGPIPTQAYPDGPVLARDPDNCAADTEEMSRYRRLSIASNRLGGRDLRVLRDNLAEMGGRARNPTEKRSVPDTISTPTYAASKRVCARKRLDSLESSLAGVVEGRNTDNTQVLNMMPFFQLQADNRAELEERQRKEDREERRAAEKMERDERDRLRNDDVARYESKLQFLLETERLRSEETNERLRLDREERDQEKKECQRRFDERLELERNEARQRHEQMMAILSAVLQNPKR